MATLLCNAQLGSNRCTGTFKLVKGGRSGGHGGGKGKGQARTVQLFRVKGAGLEGKHNNFYVVSM